MAIEDFSYTIDQVKDCINQTEQQLRELIDVILRQKYGLDWEKNVWDEKTRISLQERLHEEEHHFPNQVVSQRLLDYSDIIHLKTIIEKEWSLFREVFGSKEKIMYRFEDLHYLRNPEMHARPYLLPHQKYLCLGICGEFLSAIDYWHRGYEHSIKEVIIGLRFPVYVVDNDEMKAQEEAKYQAQQWIKEVCDNLGGRLEDKPSSNDEKAWLLKIRQGHVKVKMIWNYIGSDGRRFRAADIEMHTSTPTAFTAIKSVSRRSYWYLHWILQDDLDIGTIIARISASTGKMPSSRCFSRTDTGEELYTNMEYTVLHTDKHHIRSTFSRNQVDQKVIIGLVYDNASVNEGFHYAHEVFSLKTLFSLLYGQLEYQQMRKLIEEACTYKSNV